MEQNKEQKNTGNDLWNYDWRTTANVLDTIKNHGLCHKYCLLYQGHY